MVLSSSIKAPAPQLDYVLDPFGNQLDLVEYASQAFEASAPVKILIGRVTPIVREPVGRLPSGRIVTPLGDTAMALDPIGGQGANNGNKMARNLVESIIARKDLPFNAQWMTET
jgi:2-polyprenyl-6-methoxyphenol hydroxylase-like FAD-dependent oxidoreductase